MIATMLLVGTKRSSAGIALMTACSVSRLMKDLLMMFSVREVMSAPVGVPLGDRRGGVVNLEEPQRRRADFSEERSE